jgi:hypothetical protein
VHKNRSALSWNPGWLAVLALAMGTPLGGAWVIDAGKQRTSDNLQRFEERIAQRAAAKLDRFAQRLAIKPSQQSAWQDFENAHMVLVRGSFQGRTESPRTGVSGNADAQPPDGRNLAALSEATQKLQDVLSPDQRDALQQLAPPGTPRQRHPWHFLATSMALVFTPS